MRIVLYLLFILSFSSILIYQSDGIGIKGATNRPNYILRQSNLSSKGHFLLGYSNNNSIDLFSSRITTSVSKNTLQGSPNIQLINSSFIRVSGNLSSISRKSIRTVGSIFQTSNYLSGHGQNEVQRFDTSNSIVEIINETQINFIIKSPPPYSLINNHPDFEKIVNTNPPITAFINKNGKIHSIELNNSMGEKIGNIFAFRLSIQVLFYLNKNQKIIGYYQTTDSGFGNILPKNVIEYLGNQKFAKNLKETTIGAELLKNYNLKQIPWINQGFNDTFNLYLNKGIFSFSRSSTFASLSDRETSSLQLLEVSEDFEELSDNLISSAIITSFDEDLINQFENTIVNEIIISAISDSKTSNTSSSSNLNSSTIPIENKLVDNNSLIIVAQLSALFILTVILIKKAKNI